MGPGQAWPPGRGRARVPAAAGWRAGRGRWSCRYRPKRLYSPPQQLRAPALSGERPPSQQAGTGHRRGRRWRPRPRPRPHPLPRRRAATAGAPAGRGPRRCRPLRLYRACMPKTEMVPVPVRSSFRWPCCRMCRTCRRYCGSPASGPPGSRALGSSPSAGMVAERRPGRLPAGRGGLQLPACPLPAGALPPSPTKAGLSRQTAPGNGRSGAPPPPPSPSLSLPAQTQPSPGGGRLSAAASRLRRRAGEDLERFKRGARSPPAALRRCPVSVPLPPLWASSPPAGNPLQPPSLAPRGAGPPDRDVPGTQPLCAKPQRLFLVLHPAWCPLKIF